MVDRASSLSASPSLASVFLDPASLPVQYGMHVVGRHPLPPLSPGAVAYFDVRAAAGDGDLALIYFRPDAVARGRPWRALRRVLVGVPTHIRLPHRPGPADTVAPGILLQADEPDRAVFVPCEDVLALHRCIGYAPKGRQGVRL